MKITGTVVKLGIVSVVLLFFTVMIIVIFGQMRFDRTNGYTAEFSNVSGLRQGQFVRASGVEIGKVKALHLVDGGRRVRVEFNIDRSVPLYQSTTAQIRYSDLIGNRYVELKRGEGKGANDLLPPGGLIPLSRTSPALDLDALIGGFKPVFRALDPAKVNNIANALITVFQGQGGTINDILDQTAQLTSQIAERDQAIGEVVKNLNIVLDTTVKHRKEFDETVNNLENLITGLRNHSDQLAGGLAHISNGAGTVADLLASHVGAQGRQLPGRYSATGHRPARRVGRPAPQDADRVDGARTRQRNLRRFPELLPLRPPDQVERIPSRRAGPHGEAL